MNPRRGHESIYHLEAKTAIGRLFNVPVWSVFYEQRNADIVLLHRASCFVAAIEIESTPRNVLRNIARNSAYGCNAVAVVALNDRFFNQIANKIRNHCGEEVSGRIKVFTYDESGLREMCDWIEKLALSNGSDTGENP